ncbi:CYFA0S21e01310g1_1 [Cyberlindnera fabianii]|uniref:CYFA0S21e01310g1_1 n=1 Tax=Cyberlindnera fabianii TaxID=36022 RepID=A0A061BGF0_CYBFA|nr:CYFA0S21e01310g1_1 [Cyberlindnera fabianii]
MTSPNEDTEQTSVHTQDNSREVQSFDGQYIDNLERTDTSFSYQPDEADVESLSRHMSLRSGKEKDPFEVVFDGVDDKENIAEDMTKFRKWAITLIIAITSICVTMISSAWSMASENIQQHFSISREVSVLGISLYIWGLGLGPLFLSPISEFYGRKITYIIGLSLCTVFQFLTAFSPNFGALLFGRFMSGFFGSCFLSIAGGTITDIFKKHEIGVPMCVYSLSPFAGPSIGPLIAGFINYNIYWRWTFHVLIIFSGVCLLLVALFVPETYKPVLLIKKAKRLRMATGDDRYYCALEILQREQSVVRTCLMAPKRPLLLLLKDPMMAILCFYTGIGLATVYLFFIALPYIFRTVFNFSLWAQGTAFMGMLIGMTIGGSTAPFFQEMYNKRVAKLGKGKPEYRFYPFMIGAFVMPIGLFILAWTAYPNLHWMGAIVGSAVFGAGVALMFQGVFAYTADGYRLYAASAMACNSLVRSTLAGIFPLFGYQMMVGCGVNWGVSTLAFITIILIPAPFYFYKHGEKLREKSPYAWSMD